MNQLVHIIAVISLIFPLACWAELQIVDSGVLPLKRGDIGMIFFVTVKNTCHKTYRVTINMVKCCEDLLMDEPPDCDTISLIGGNMGELAPNETRDLSYIFPNLYPYNRQGDCEVAVLYRYQHLKPIEVKATIFFDTMLLRTLKVPKVLKGFYNPITVRQCASIDEDPLDNCLPVDCGMKYSGHRSHYNHRRKICEKVPICSADPHKELPDIVYVPVSNECRNMEDSLTEEDLRYLAAAGSSSPQTGDWQSSMLPLMPQLQNMRCHHGHLDNHSGVCLCDQGWGSLPIDPDTFYPIASLFHMCTIRLPAGGLRGRLDSAVVLVIPLLLFLLLGAACQVYVTRLDQSSRGVAGRRVDPADEADAVSVDEFPHYDPPLRRVPSSTTVQSNTYTDDDRDAANKYTTASEPSTVRHPDVNYNSDGELTDKNSSTPQSSYVPGGGTTPASQQVVVVRCSRSEVYMPLEEDLLMPKTSSVEAEPSCSSAVHSVMQEDMSGYEGPRYYESPRCEVGTRGSRRSSEKKSPVVFSSEIRLSRAESIGCACGSKSAKRGESGTTFGASFRLTRHDDNEEEKRSFSDFDVDSLTPKKSGNPSYESQMRRVPKSRVEGPVKSWKHEDSPMSLSSDTKERVLVKKSSNQNEENPKGLTSISSEFSTIKSFNFSEDSLNRVGSDPKDRIYTINSLSVNEGNQKSLGSNSRHVGPENELRQLKDSQGMIISGSREVGPVEKSLKNIEGSSRKIRSNSREVSPVGKSLNNIEGSSRRRRSSSRDVSAEEKSGNNYEGGRNSFPTMSIPVRKSLNQYEDIKRELISNSREDCPMKRSFSRDEHSPSKLSSNFTVSSSVKFVAMHSPRNLTSHSREVSPIKKIMGCPREGIPMRKSFCPEESIEKKISSNSRKVISNTLSPRVGLSEKMTSDSRGGTSMHKTSSPRGAIPKKPSWNNNRSEIQKRSSPREGMAEKISSNSKGDFSLQNTENISTKLSSNSRGENILSLRKDQSKKLSSNSRKDIPDTLSPRVGISEKMTSDSRGGTSMDKTMSPREAIPKNWKTGDEIVKILSPRVGISAKMSSNFREDTSMPKTLSLRGAIPKNSSSRSRGGFSRPQSASSRDCSPKRPRGCPREGIPMQKSWSPGREGSPPWQ